MANFNAGAIEGTLTLDRSPFNRDLKEAMAEAKKFEQNKIKVPLEIVDERAIDELKAKLESLQDQTVNIDLDVDGGDQIGVLEERLNAIRDETVTIELDVDGEDKIAELEARLDAIRDETVNVNVDTDEGSAAIQRFAGKGGSNERALDGMRFAIAGIAAILPAIVPAALTAAAAVGALVSTTSILAVGVGAFALVAIPAWKAYTKAVKAAGGDLSKLSPQMRALKAEQDNLNKTLATAGNANKIYAIIGGGMRLIATIVQRAKPLIDAVTIAISQLVTQLIIWAQSPAFTQVIAFLTTAFTPAFKNIIAILGNLITMIGGLVVAFEPFSRIFMGGLADMTQAWSDWANSLSTSQKFQDFLAYVKETGPKVIELFKSVANAIENIGQSLAPLGGPVLDALIGFFNAIGNMNTQVLGAILVGLATLIVLVQAATAAMALFAIVSELGPLAIVVVIIALVAAFLYLWKTSDGFRNFFIGLWNSIWGFMKAVGAWFAGPFAGFFVAGFNAVMAAVRFVWSVMVAVWTAIQTAIAAVAGAISAVITTVFNGIKAFILGWIATVRAAWQVFWNIFGGVITAAINLAKAVVALGFALMRFAINTAMLAIKTVITTVWNGIKAVITSAVNTIKAGVTAAWNAIKSVSSTIWNGIKTVVVGPVKALWGALSGPIGTVKNGISSAWNSVKSTTSSIWNSLKGIVSSAINGVYSTVSGVVSKIKGIFSGASSWLYNAGRDIIQGLLSGIESLINSVTSKLKALTDKIPKVKGPEERDKKLLRPAGRMIMTGFIDELTKGIDQALGVLGDFSGTIPNALEVQQALSLQPTTGPAAFPTPAPGMTKSDFVELVSQLITEIRNNTQPLIGNYYDAHKDPREIAEEWWFVTKGR